MHLKHKNDANFVFVTVTVFCMYSFKKSVHITLIHQQEGIHCQFNDCCCA